MVSSLRWIDLNYIHVESHMQKATRVYGGKSPTQKANATSLRHRDSSLNGMKAEPLQPRFHGIDQVQASKYVPRKADSIKYEIVAKNDRNPAAQLPMPTASLPDPFWGRWTGEIQPTRLAREEQS